MERFTRLDALACPLGLANVDTDQLIPARFMSRPRAQGYGQFLLHDLRFAGDSYDDRGNFTRLDSYGLLTLRASLPLGERFELYGRVENVTDTDYQTVAGYGTYGRSAFLGVRAKW